MNRREFCSSMIPGSFAPAPEIAAAQPDLDRRLGLARRAGPGFVEQNPSISCCSIWPYWARRSADARRIQQINRSQPDRPAVGVLLVSAGTERALYSGALEAGASMWLPSRRDHKPPTAIAAAPVAQRSGNSKRQAK